MASILPFDTQQNYRKADRDPKPVVDTGGVTVTIEGDGDPQFDPATGTTQIALPDGQVEITFGEKRKERESKNFDDNLAEDLAEGDLSTIAERLLRLIEIDDQSRQTWLENVSNGISLLGLEVKHPRGAAASGATPSEGVSTVDHPLLLEATLRGQANARGELLPSDGPVKVRVDGEATAWVQRLADALEKDLNHYLTVVADEYYPDTDRLLFLTMFAGIGFKKGFHCPLRRRPVIESIEAKDLIVSNASTNLKGAGRVTHRIMMRPSILKRMQILGRYRNVDLPYPGPPPLKNPVDQKIDQVQGVAPPSYSEPEDQDRELYECYAEIDVPGFEHRDEKTKEETGLPLPYVVTIDKDARRVLAIRRNWEEEDDLCMPRSRLIAYIYVPGLGFYGIGLLNILGNATKAVTAAWRLMLDAGMFANFPGFLYLKSLAKQLTNQFRISPGSGMPIDTVGTNIRDSVMPLPYKDPSAVFIQLMDNIVQTAQRVGSTAELQIGEGKQDAPVGTTLALIEQATKLMSAVHKRFHTAQSQEFVMLKELLMEDPSALWRHNKKSKVLKFLVEQAGQQPIADAEEQAEERHKELFLAALNDIDLVPRADPNTASQTERYLKVTAMKQIAATNPNIDQNEVDLRALHVLGIDDAESLFKPPPPPGAMPPNPDAMEAQATIMAAQARMMDSQTRQIEAGIKAKSAQDDSVTKAQELQSKEHIAQLGVSRELVIHQSDAIQREKEMDAENTNRAADRAHKLALANISARAGTVNAGVAAHADLLQTGMAQQHEARQAGLARAHEVMQGGLDRAHEASQASVARTHEAVQGHLDRQVQQKLAQQKPEGET